MEKKKHIEQSLSAAAALHQAGNLNEAETAYRAVLLSYPTNPDALKLLGILNIQRGNPEEALRCIDACLHVKPSQPDMLNNRANLLKFFKRYDEALASYDKAIALKPDYADAYYNRGATLQEIKRYDDALASYGKAIALNPAYAEAYNNMGVTLWELKRYDEALASYGKAVALNPAHAEAYNNMGTLFLGLSRYDEARDRYRQALALNPDTPYAMGDWLYAKMHLADWQGMDEGLARLAQNIEAGRRAATPFIMVATPSSETLQKQCAEMYVRDTCPPAASPLWNGERYAHDKIRIGYFSADFHSHATAYLMAGLLERHDRSRFEVTAFSFGSPKDDAMRDRIEKACDRFIDVSATSDPEIAALARNMEIDIAVDLKGFTQNARTGIFALRPAPVQVNYLGYPGTMGASYIDYIIADATVIPENHQRYYSEKIVTLPHSYQVNDSSRIISDSKFNRRELGLPETGFVFCCFNSHYKITPDVFAIWMRLLSAVEGSVLWLFEGHPACVANLRKEAESRGVKGERLVFAPRMNAAEHLARHRLADLFLDTLHCNAHTTASDALWAGLPVLTCLGETFASRVAASLLNAVGLPGLIARSPQEYETLALELATHPQTLSGVRATLAQHRNAHPLFDTALFTRHLENAYATMWERSQAGLKPDHIYVR